MTITWVHIGQHKSGTTSIQQCLKDYQQQLLNQGVYYPNDLCGYTNRSHFALNLFALDKNQFSPKKEKLLRDLDSKGLQSIIAKVPQSVTTHYSRAAQQSCQRVMWSNEGLYLLNSEAEYLRLYQLLKIHSDRVIAICCFREQQVFRESYKKEMSKLNRLPSKDQDSFLYTEPDSWLFDYQRKQLLLNKVFDEVVCFPYDEQDNVAAFCDHANLKIRMRDPYRLNITPGE